MTRPTTQVVSGPAPTSRRKRPRLRKWRNAAGRWLGERLGAAAIVHLTKASTHIDLDAEVRERAQAQHPALILAFWHGRGVLAAPFYPPGNTTALVSASEDGSMATKILDKLGYEIIRGSSSRHGVRALREMLACLKRGKHVAITPDGPRGPMHSMSPGAAFLSRATGTPVLPIGFGIDRARRLDTWDRYTLPRRRARLVSCCGEPIQVPREAGGGALGEYSSRIRTAIREAERRAFAHLDLEPDWEGWVPDEEAEHTPEHGG